MGWADCGTDSDGRPIGYAFPAVCDYPGCSTTIDRGLSYACGPMHGAGSYYCEQYFCEEHLISVEVLEGDAVPLCVSLCPDCYKAAEKEGILVDE